MINYTDLRNGLVAGVYAQTGSLVVPAEQTAHKPPYPFVTYSFLSLHQPERGFKAVESDLAPAGDGSGTEDLRTTHTDQPHMVLSLTAVSRDPLDAAALAHEVYEWFTVHGYAALKALNCVVVETRPISNRHSLLLDDYEQKFGFDVRIRVLDQAVQTTERIETVIAQPEP